MLIVDIMLTLQNGIVVRFEQTLNVEIYEVVEILQDLSGKAMAVVEETASLEESDMQDKDPQEVRREQLLEEIKLQEEIDATKALKEPLQETLQEPVEEIR